MLQCASKYLQAQHKKFIVFLHFLVDDLTVLNDKIFGMARSSDCQGRHINVATCKQIRASSTEEVHCFFAFPCR